MASFNSIPSAVDCAATIQRSFVDYNTKGGEPIHVGIGIHAGEPIEDSDDLFGSTVQLASRICDTADPDGVVVSDVVRQASGAVQSFTDLGHRDFKGFGEPIQVFDFDWR
jgi:class 3 adenylate cyclase